MNVDRGRPDDQRRNFAVAAVLLVHLLLAPTPTYGQALKEVAYAPDVTVTLGGTGVGAGGLAADDLSGGVTVLAIPDLPAAASISAVHRFPNGDLLLAFDSTLALPGAGIVEPRDLVRFTSATEVYSVPVRGADVGIPNGARIDALAVTGAEAILLSLDVSVGMFDDEDVLRIDGNSLVLFLDLSEFGIAQSLDLDGLDVEEESGNTRLYVSFDGSGTVDAVAFDDEDIVVFDLTTHVWALAYDGSAAAAQWPAAADLIALDVVLEATATATPTSTSPLVTSTATATATVTPTQPVADTATATSTASAATGTATATATLPAATSTETVTFTPVAGTATATATGPNATATVTATATQSPTGPVPSTATATATATVAIPCPGDCDGSGDVTIDELVRLVNIALDSQPLSLCPAGDLDNSGSIAINEIVAAVNSALFGCP